MTTPSLKEEIFELTKQIHTYPLPDDTIDQILKLIENRIDSIELWCGKCNDKSLDKFKEMLNEQL